MHKISDLAKKIRKNSHRISENIIYRWSPRSMNGKTLPEKLLTPLFQAALYAPSAFNNQPERFYYAKRGSKSFQELLQALSPFNQKWCQKASFLIVLVSKKTYDYNGKPNPTHSFDTGAAWQAFAMEGTKRNLIIHGMSGFDYQVIAEFLKLSNDFQVECMIAVGQPSDKIKKEEITTRKPLDHVVIKLP